MAFSIKQLLLCMAYIAIGLMALANADVPWVKQTINLLTAAMVILLVYGAWMSDGETRAFRIGFLCWVALFCGAIIWPFDIGANKVIGFANEVLRPKSPVGDWINSYFQIGRCLLSLLFGLVGGWVTVYCYRKRQRMLEQ